MSMSAVRSVDFDFFLPTWEIDQNAITFAYGVHFWKKIYGRNRHDDPDVMALVSSDHEKFYF